MSIRRALLPAVLLSLLASVLPVLPASALVDPCLECGAVYSGGGSGTLYKLDVAGGTSTFIAALPEAMFDIAISSDGQLYGIGGSGTLYRITTCTGTAIPIGAGFGVNGLAGANTGATLFGQGPPLVSIDPATSGTTLIGGSIGPSPPGWCGGSSGDLTQDPVTGVLYSVLGCGGCGGDRLVSIDPATGNEIADLGCIHDAVSGVGYSGVFGIAFDSNCRLVAGDVFGPYILVIDPTNAAAVQEPITGGYVETYGFASIQCGPCAGATPTCEPLTQGFWKRQCKGPHPSGEPGLLPTYVACVSREATFATVATVADICRRLNPDPANDKCQQAEAQFMALMLNTCSGRLGRTCCIHSTWTSATTVGAAIDQIDALLSQPLRTFNDCVLAQGIADDINTAHALCGGTTTHIQRVDLEEDPPPFHSSPKPPHLGPIGRRNP
jgi:hypothetical protein